jgi:hypothetical protein
VKYDELDQLFLPLLSSAQNTNDILGLRVGGTKSALHAAAHFAGELMRDVSFVPVRSLSINAANAYLLDFAENSFQVETSVNTRDERRSSLFRVKVLGAIRGDKFMVIDPVTKSSLFTFTRFEANKSGFFASEFPFIAHESRNNPAMFAGDNSTILHGMIDLTLGIPVGDETITVRIHKQSDTRSAEVKNPVTNETVMSLPLALLSNITKMVENISQHLAMNSKARLALAPDTAAQSGGMEGAAGETTEPIANETSQTPSSS